MQSTMKHFITINVNPRACPWRSLLTKAIKGSLEWNTDVVYSLKSLLLLNISGTKHI